MGVSLVVGAIASGFGAGITVTAGAIAFTGFSYAAFAVSLVLGGLQAALAPKPPKGGSFGSGTAAKAEGLTRNVRQAITTRRTVYGEQRIGGAMTFIETTDDDKFLHLVLTVADHEIEEIGEIWINEVSIAPDALDGSGNVTSGTYQDKMRIKKHLGTVGQAADSDLIAETSADSTFTGSNVAYIYVRMEYDRDVYPQGIPTITAFIKGKKVYDLRDTTTRYTANTMLYVYDYLTTNVQGLVTGVGVSAASIDTTAATAAFNICDEVVTTTLINDSITSADSATDILTLTGLNDRCQYQTGDQVVLTGGSLPPPLVAATNYYVISYQRRDTVRIKLATTLANAMAGTAITITGDGTGSIDKNGEPRYYGGGVVDTSETPEQNMEDLLSGSGGNATYIGGKWFLRAAAYTAPVFTFDENHFISPLVVRPKVSRRDRFNMVKGVYVSQLNDGQASDYPSVKNATYKASDGGITLPIDYDLPMTQRPHTAQRLAKIKLEKHRQEIFFEAEFSLHAMQVQPTDIVYIDNDRMGWAAKEFEVISWTLGAKKVGNANLFFVKMALQETASAVYDWNNGEETTVDPAPNTNLPNPFLVPPPTGLNVTPVEIGTAGGDLTYEFVVGWTPPNDIFVTNGGYYEIQFKRSLDSDWSRSYRAEDSDVNVTIKQVQPAINYDVRVRAVSNIGVRSTYNSLFGVTVSSPSGATQTLDYGQITGAVVDSFDYALITDIVDNNSDFGGLT